MNNIVIDKNAFAIKLKNLRKKFEFTQLFVANELNITRTSLMNYENGKFLPDIVTLLKLCSLYNCSLNELLCFDDFDIMNYTNLNHSTNLNTSKLLKQLKENLHLVSELNLKNIKLNNELIAEKNKFAFNTRKGFPFNSNQTKILTRLNTSQKHYTNALSELETAKKRYDSAIEKLNFTTKKVENLLSDLLEAKEKYHKLINSLTSSRDFYLKASSDIDDTRTYFLNSFSNILENANNLISRLEIDSDITNIETNINPINITEEISDELIPEVNCDDSNYIDIDEEDTEPTVKVAYFPDESTAAGSPIGYSEYPSMQPMELKARYPLTTENSNNFFVIKVEGNSMNKIVEDGTKILVRANRFIENGTIALVHIADKEGTTLKYYYYDSITRTVTLSPYSTDPSYKDMVFSDKHQVIVQGEYIGPISDFL